MGLSAFIDTVGRDLIQLPVLLMGLMAAGYDGWRGRLVFALLCSALLEFYQSQATPSFEWTYQFSWFGFLAQTVVIATVALLLGWLGPKLNRFRKPAPN